MASITKCHRDHPYRPVTWRWERARFLREQKLKWLSGRGPVTTAQSDDDKYVLIASRFQYELSRCKSDLDRYRLMDRNRALFYAYDMWDENEGDYANPAKYEIEARILSKQDLKLIADKVCAPLESIEWYERLFFNVTDRITSESYILHQAIGPAIHRGFSERQYDLLWKLFSYFLGPVALEVMMSTFCSRPVIDTADKMHEYLAQDARHTIRRKTAIAARTMTINNFNQIPLMEIQAKFEELERDLASGAQEASILNNIRAMMPIIPWAVGKTPPATMDPKVVAYYDKANAAEPRANELLATSMGEIPASVAELTTMTFPPPPEGNKP